MNTLQEKITSQKTEILEYELKLENAHRDTLTLIEEKNAMELNTKIEKENAKKINLRG